MPAFRETDIEPDSQTAHTYRQTEGNHTDGNTCIHTASQAAIHTYIYTNTYVQGIQIDREYQPAIHTYI